MDSGYDLATSTKQTALSSATRELLVWVSRGPRTYAETIKVWRTSCPRHAVWEDAAVAGLVQVTHGTEVTLTARVRAALAGVAASGAGAVALPDAAQP